MASAGSSGGGGDSGTGSGAAAGETAHITTAVRVKILEALKSVSGEICGKGRSATMDIEDAFECAQAEVISFIQNSTVQDVMDLKNLKRAAALEPNPVSKKRARDSNR